MRYNDVVVFDGICKLCTRSVRFILRRDYRNTFLFASLQSEIGSQLLREYGFQPETADTILLIKDGKVFTQSDAVFEILSEFRPYWRMLLVFRIVPKKTRDATYRVIARNRYRWFGKKDQCMIPSPEIKAKFLE